jgi:cell envelope-related function transcriptional attenuator common domain
MFKTESEDIQFEDLSSYSSTKEYRKRKKNKKGRIVLKSILAVFFVCLILSGTGLIYLSLDLVSGLSTFAITKDSTALGISPDATTDKNITNIAFFGVDARDGSFSGLSDTIMIVTIDNLHNKIKMTSILRDSLVFIENGSMQKINAAYSLGGPQLAIKTLNQNFKLNITDFVTVNFSRMAELIDAFSGVEITMTDEEAYQTNRNLMGLKYDQIDRGFEQTIFDTDYLPAEDGPYIEGNRYQTVRGGTFHLNGNQAVAYSRNRTDSDNERSERQKRVLMGLLIKLTGGEGSEDIDYYSLAQDTMPLALTSFTFDDAWKLMPILTKSFDIETLTIPGIEDNAFGGDYGDGLGWVFDYDLEYAAQRIDIFINEEISPYWNSSNNAQGNGADDVEDNGGEGPYNQ